MARFVKVFSECSVLQDFIHEFEHLDTYRIELKKFMNLRKTASFRYADQDVDFEKYKQALIKIMDTNIKADEAELLTRQISINDKKVFEEALADLGSDKSKAEAIAAQMDKTISDKMQKDPEFYRRFSLKIKKLLEEMKNKKIADIEALRQAKLIQDEVLNKIIKKSEGCVRDALTLFDQISATGEKNLTVENTKFILPTTNIETQIKFVQ